MARTTKQLSGAAKDKLLKGLAHGVEGLTASDARRVGDRLTAVITEVRVRRDVWEALRAEPRPTAATPAAPLPSRPPAVPTAVPVAPPTAAGPVATPPAASPSTFDPYAFSTVAVLTRKGEAALAAELAKVERLEDLRALALAQHLALDPTVTDLTAVRTALVAATQRRIADRKAAAS